MKKLLLTSLVATALMQIPCEAVETEFPGKGSKKDWAKACRVYDKALSMRKRGNIAEAVKLYEEAISIYPNDGDFYYNLAIHYARDNKNYQRAEQLIDTAIKLKPEKYSFQFERAAILIEQDKLAEAKGILVSAEKLKKTDEQETERKSILAQINERI